MDYEDSSSESSCEGGEQLETAEILGQQIAIPQGVLESSEIFNLIFSQETFDTLDADDRERLMQLLPTFPENDEEEKKKTMTSLLNRENFKFGSPLEQFHAKLHRGHFRPDIAHLHHLMRKATRRQYKEYKKRMYYSMLKTIIVSRRQVLEQASSAPPGPLKPQKPQYSSPTGDLLSQRVKKRYFKELAGFRNEVGEFSQSSEDENYSDRAPKMISKKQRQRFQTMENSFSMLDMKMITSTMATKPRGFDLENHITNSSNPYEISDEAYRKMLSSHRRKRAAQDKSAKLTPSATLLKELQGRMGPGKRRLSVKSGGNSSPVLSSDKAKKKPSSNCSTPIPRFKSDSGLSDISEQNLVKRIKYEFDSEIAKKTGDSTDEEIQGVLEPSELDKNIDVESSSPTNIPQNQKLMENQAQQHLSLAESVPFSNHDALEEEVVTPFKHTRTTDLMQDTHVCFFSLLRDIICSSPQHRMRLDRIENRLKVWESNPISPLNEWFSLVDESWYNLLDSALCFLSGEFPGLSIVCASKGVASPSAENEKNELEPEDFVPYIEFKSNQKSYQWIGAGRDSDSHLLALCSHWLDHREEMSPSSSMHASVTTTPAPEAEPESVEGEDGDDSEPQPIVSVIAVGEEPPPRWSTNWMVRPSTEEEKQEFQVQERERFQNPTKAFTYVMHGYESVVGPVKGINANQTTSSVLKPRGHNLLTQTRPNYVTVLSLVRDAAARLPNGEGTRSDMCTLLKDSQYLDLTAAGDTTLQNVVSSALDRLHYEMDSCVRFDTKRKMWIYLHRNRTEKEMENMYYIYQGMSKTVKKTPRKKPIKKTDTNGTPKEKEPRKPKNSQSAKLMALMKETEDAVTAVSTLKESKESQVVEKPVVAEPVEPAKQEKRSVAQEIVTSSGKKILIQTTFAGRNPMKFVSTPSTSKATLVTKTVDTAQAKTQSNPESTVSLFKTNPAVPTSTVQTTTTGQSFLVNNLGGTQFLTASGQKVQIIAGGTQNIGQMPNIQLTKNIQSMLAKNVQSGNNSQTTPSLLQNIQQVQIMTSSGQIIARTIPASAKNTLANLQVRSVTQLPANDETKASVLKTTLANNVRTTIAASQVAQPKATVAKNMKNIRINMSTPSEMKATMSLLTSSQAKPGDKETDQKMKVAGIQVMQKPGGKLGTQILNVAHLLNKPMMPKNNAAVLTGVKLVNTQQGKIKMVATSATTVVQTVIPTPKGTSTVAKSLQVPTSSDMNQIQGTNQQIISMEALVQGARNQTSNKGQTSLIQLATTPGQPAQFAVVSQGSIQPRIIQAQIPGMIQSVASQHGGSQAKATLSNVRMTTNVTLANMKPVILAKPQSQAQNMILTTDGSVGSQALVLTPHTGVRPATSGAVSVMQPGNSQQINLPFGYKGLKVLPIGGPKVYARFVKNPQTQPVEVPKSEEQ